MLEALFGNPVIEKILFYILVNQKCYPSQLKKVFQAHLYSFQRALMRLEKGGIGASSKEGKTTMYQFNPRYPFLEELKIFLLKAYESFPEEFREKYYEQTIRTRPRIFLSCKENDGLDFFETKLLEVDYGCFPGN